MNQRTSELCIDSFAHSTENSTSVEKSGCNKGMADQLSENQVTDEKRFRVWGRLSFPISWFVAQS